MGQLTSANTPTSNPNPFLSLTLNTDIGKIRNQIKLLQEFLKIHQTGLLPKKEASKLIKMGEENGYSWFCWRRSPAYSAAPKAELPELNPSPLQRASGTVLVELVELPMGPFSISTSDTNNSNNKCDELSNVPTSLHTSYSSSTSTGNRLPAMSISSSMSSISSSNLPPYSELVKELGTL